MKPIEDFFRALDGAWRSKQKTKIRLEIIGASAIWLQSNYNRGTKDSDILETSEISPEISKTLLALTDAQSILYKRFRIYIQIVKRAIPFLPQVPKFHPVSSLQKLKNFSIYVLDPTDIAVSKLKRFNATDISDITFLIEKGMVPHKKLVTRFNLAIDANQEGARADDFPKYIQNLNTIERDVFNVPESKIDLPDWI